jgi:hypothetical protein
MMESVFSLKPLYTACHQRNSFLALAFMDCTIQVIMSCIVTLLQETGTIAFNRFILAKPYRKDGEPDGALVCKGKICTGDYENTQEASNRLSIFESGIFNADS